MVSYSGIDVGRLRSKRRTQFGKQTTNHVKSRAAEELQRYAMRPLTPV